MKAFALTRSVVLAMVCLATLVGCSRDSAQPQPQPQTSAIVALLTDAGSGSVDELDDLGVKRFLGAHESVASQVAQACIPLRNTQRGTAWENTPEGRVCEAVRHVYTPPIKTDGQGFRGGSS